MKPLAILSLLIIISCIAAGCTDPNAAAAGDENIFIDDTGTAVTVPADVSRIISLAPSETEIVASVGALDRLVGRTDYCNYPPGIEGVASIGGPQTMSVEKVVELQPDLILATTISDKIRVEELRTMGFAVLVFRLECLEDIYRNIGVVGSVTLRSSVTEPTQSADVTNSGSTADELISQLRAREKAVSGAAHASEAVPVLYVLWDDPLYVAANNTLQHELIVKSGGWNIMEDASGYVIASDEAVINRAPEIILASTSHTPGSAPIGDRLMEKSIFADLPAIKNGRIYTIDGDIINRPGPRMLDALEWVSSCING